MIPQGGMMQSRGLAHDALHQSAVDTWGGMDGMYTHVMYMYAEAFKCLRCCTLMHMGLRCNITQSPPRCDTAGQ